MIKAAIVREDTDTWWDADRVWGLVGHFGICCCHLGNSYCRKTWAEKYILWRDWEQRTPYASGSYCTVASPLQPADTSSPTLPHSHTANGEENHAYWAFHYSPLVNIHQSLNFNYRKDIYLLLFTYKLYMDLQYDYHIVHVPNTAEMAFLIMYNFLLCGKWVDEWFIEIRDKAHLY